MVMSYPFLQSVCRVLDRIQVRHFTAPMMDGGVHVVERARVHDDVVRG